MAPPGSHPGPGADGHPDPLWNALEESRNVIEEIEELAELGRWEWDILTDHIEGSHRLYAIYGLDPEVDVLDQERFRTLVHPDDLDRVMGSIQGIVEGSGKSRLRFRIQRPDGNERWVLTRARLELDEDDRPARMIGTTQDVTEQERAQAELRVSEARYRGLFEQAAVGVAEIETATGRFVRTNQKLCEILGRRREVVEATTFLEVTYPEDLPEDLANMEDLKAGTIREFSMEKRYVRPDGSLVWVDLSVSPLWGPGESPTHHVAVAVDITDRKETREALQESETLFRDLTNHIQEVFWMFDWVDQKVLYVSPAWEKIWGRPRESLYRDYQEWGNSIHPEDQAYAVRTFERLPETGGGDAREYRIVRPDGGIRWISDRAFVIRDSEGGVIRAAGIAEDVTDKKKAEEERQAFQAKLQHSQKLESLGVLAGGIAHDFNNLLMAILGNADLALDTLAPESPGRDYVEKIETTAQRAAGLTNQMLAYSGKGRFLIQSIQLDRLVGEMAHLLDTVISKKADLQFNFAPDLPAVEADASQIRQIVMNLITNGSEALGEAPGTLRVATGTVEADRAYLSRCYMGEEVPEGTYVFLEVSDTGEGMDQETAKKIFDPFFTTKFTGRGLGLAAVLGIVRGHQGTINVYSEPEMGSAFKVLLPVSTRQAETRPKQQMKSPAPSEGATVLVVEDDDAVLDVTSLMLEKAGFRVLTATNGQEGVELFSLHREKIALVVLDMTMPIMDGEEAFRAMREAHPQVRVILSSGYNEQDATNRFAGEGLAGFIQKPYRSSDLLARVEEALKGS